MPQAVNADASPSKAQHTAPATVDGKPSQKNASKPTEQLIGHDMANGRSIGTNSSTKSPKMAKSLAKSMRKPSDRYIRQDEICRALREIILDRQAPASARAAAARTLLDELNRRGHAGDRPLSALSVDELQAELDAGENAG
jgi:hypothetical protein